MVHELITKCAEGYDAAMMNACIKDSAQDVHKEYWNNYALNFNYVHMWAFKKEKLPPQLRTKIGRWFFNNHEGIVREMYRPLLVALEKNVPEEVNPKYLDGMDV